MSPSVPVTSARAHQALSVDDLRRVAPSVFAETARPGVSSRYTFVSTVQVVDLLRGEGWEPVKAGEQRVRLDARRGFQLHEVRFARRIDLDDGFRNVGDTRPEMILQNAHDGTRAYRIDAGLYRLVCRNGLTVADSDFAHVSIRHLDVSAEKFACAARAVAENTPRVLELINRWQAVTLSDAAREEFARRAAALRWDPEQPIGRAISPNKLLAPLRYGDAAVDLWTTFNVVQEHLLRGGDRYVPAINGSPLRQNKTRPVGSLHASQSLNKQLWSIAAEFADICRVVTQSDLHLVFHDSSDGKCRLQVCNRACRAGVLAIWLGDCLSGDKRNAGRGSDGKPATARALRIESTHLRRGRVPERDHRQPRWNERLQCH